MYYNSFIDQLPIVLKIFEKMKIVLLFLVHVLIILFKTCSAIPDIKSN